MFGEAFKRKYALTDRGVENTKKGTFWTVIVISSSWEASAFSGC